MVSLSNSSARFSRLSGAALFSAARLALVSIGSELSSDDSELASDHVRERVRLMAKVCLSLDCFILIAGNAHRAAFVAHAPGVRAIVVPSLAIHACILAFELGVWLSARRVKSSRSLALLDGGLVLAIIAGHALQAIELDLPRFYRLDLTMVQAASLLLFSRAAIVPSRPHTTFVISALAVVPALGIAVWEGTRRGALLETLSFDALWCASAVALTTFTSQVIYGLRKSVAIAEHFGRYVIERKIGQGGMGEVYLARHTLLRRPTAVKLLPPGRLGVKAVARFEREVRETSMLSHPNTVAIYDYGRTRSGVFYYAMEYLAGLDLQRLVEQTGPLPPARVIHVLCQVSGALAEAHSRGLVHRDVKPANVILCERGGLLDTAKVVDFGLVKDVALPRGTPGQTEVNTVIGTPAYLAPEAITDPDHVDARIDLYAVGAMAYFLLTGKTVFQGMTFVAQCLGHLHEIPVPPSQRVEHELPKDLEALVLRCLAKKPTDRPASASELRDALLACAVTPWTPHDASRFWHEHAATGARADAVSA